MTSTLLKIHNDILSSMDDGKLQHLLCSTFHCLQHHQLFRYPEQNGRLVKSLTLSVISPLTLSVISPAGDTNPQCSVMQCTT